MADIIKIDITEPEIINIQIIESEPINIEIKETVMTGLASIFEPPEGGKRIIKLFWKDGKFQGEYLNE
jgi:hypothetical protein